MEWRKFVVAMTEARFDARQSSGSAVTFNNENGRTVIHKPHPMAKLDYRSLLTIGKRLNRRFGLV